jgi:hypothetical protein
VGDLHLDAIRWELQPASAGTQTTSEPTPTTPHLPSLLHDIQSFIAHYVVLTREQAITAALWTAHTHVIDAADTTPYLQVGSATKRAGKTRLLEVLETLVSGPWLTGRTSVAALVRKIDRDMPTLLLDESDAAFRGEQEYTEALRGILNTGYKRSGTASLCVGKGAEITVKDFSTFGPKAIAGIGRLPDTIADRAIPILLRRRMASEPIARWRDRDARASAAPIRAQLAFWAGRSGVLELLRDSRPDLPQLSDRAADVWEPLLAIADLAGDGWPERARSAAVALMGTSEDTDPVVELLTDVREILRNYQGDTIPTKALIEALVADEARPWATWRKGDKPITARGLARLLGPLGVHPMRDRAFRGYRIDGFDDAIGRYLPLQASMRHVPNVDGLKARDAADSSEPREQPSVTQYEADFVGPVTHRHIETRDTGPGGDRGDAERY